MELRKIQVTGGSTHVVSLPKKWVDRTGLGDRMVSPNFGDRMEIVAVRRGPG